MTNASTPSTEPAILDVALDALRSALPLSWRVVLDRRKRPSGTTSRPDAVVRVVAPDGGASGRIVLDVKRHVSPRSADAAADQLRVHLAHQGGAGVVVAPWVSPRTQDVLGARGVGFIDLTGNIELTLDRPGLVIRTEGARRDPDPKPALAPSLKGPRAWALLRALVEVQLPYGVRELAAATGVDPGYMSRILRVLEDGLLITRRARGPVTDRSSAVRVRL